MRAAVSPADGGEVGRGGGAVRWEWKWGGLEIGERMGVGGEESSGEAKEGWGGRRGKGGEGRRERRGR